MGLAKSIHHARVLIRQRHIRYTTPHKYMCPVCACSVRVLFILFINFFSSRVRKQIVNVPSFVVRLDSQKHIDFALTSPFGGGRPGRVKRRNMRKATNKGEVEEEDDD